MKKTVFILGMTLGVLILTGLWPLMVSADASTEKGVPQEQEELHPTWADVKPKIDGVLDEKIWQVPPLEKPFTSYSPHYDIPSPFKTLVWISQDSTNLYFAFLCLDPEPKKLQNAATEKDQNLHDDWVGICLDPLGTKMIAWGLFINPGGVQTDGLATSHDETIAVDFDWESAGKVTEKGYQVELRVPLKSIDFKSGKEVKMGILFWRKIARKSVNVAWPRAIPGGRVFSSLTPIVYKNLKNPLKLEVQPHAVYGSSQQRVNPDQWGEKDILTDVGINIKYGLTSSITSDILINPDFTEVENDLFQLEVNQRYEVGYDELRPFFKEGFEVFDFFVLPCNPFRSHLATVIPQSYFMMPVYTRRFLEPQWAAKVTGSIGKTSVGFLFTGDDQPGLPWQVGENPNEGKQAFWGLARGKFNLGKDNFLGLFYSGREFAGEYNRVFGADVFHRLGKKHRVHASFLHSLSSDQDPNGRDLKSSNFNFLYNYMTDKTIVRASFEHIGTDFKMDSAYLLRNGINHGVFLAEYTFVAKSKWLQQITPGITAQYLHDLHSGMDDSVLMLQWKGWYAMGAYSAMGYAFRKESWMGHTYDLRQFLLFGQIELTNRVRLHGRLTLGDKIFYDSQPSFKGKGTDLFCYIDFTPIKNLNQLLMFRYSDFVKDSQKKYKVNILISRTTYKPHKNIFLKAIVQYNSYQKKLLAEGLGILTIIPGTELHVGYRGFYENREWWNGNWVYGQGDLLNINRGFFAKVSYRWRF